MADDISTTGANNAALVLVAQDEFNTASAALAAGDVGPSGMILLMAATSKFTMALEAISSIQKVYGEACVSPARKIS